MFKIIASSHFSWTYGDMTTDLSSVTPTRHKGGLAAPHNQPSKPVEWCVQRKPLQQCTPKLV